MAFVRVTDPELARELRDNNLLYEQPYDGRVPTVIQWGWDAGRLDEFLASSWKFYMYPEE